MQFNWAIIFYIVGIYGLVRYLSKSPKDQDRNKVNWSPVESVAITIFIYFFGQIIGGFLIYGAPLLLGFDQGQIVDWVGKDAIGQFLAILIIDVITVFLLMRFLKKRKNSLRTIGLIKSIKWRDVFYALGFYILYFISFLIVIRLLTYFIPAIDVDQKQQIGFKSVTEWKLPFVFISLVILPPIVEELLIRGFLYGGLRKRMPTVIAALLTSIIFAIAHLQFGSGEKLLWIAAIDTFVLSIFLIILREKTKGLWSPIFLHGIKNLIAFVSLFILKVG